MLKPIHRGQPMGNLVRMVIRSLQATLVATGAMIIELAPALALDDSNTGAGHELHERSRGAASRRRRPTRRQYGSFSCCTNVRGCQWPAYCTVEARSDVREWRRRSARRIEGICIFQQAGRRL